MKHFMRMVAFVTLFFFSTLAFAFQGKVVGVSDGDTITVMHEGKGVKIRLYGVDPPMIIILEHFFNGNSIGLRQPC